MPISFPTLRLSLSVHSILFPTSCSWLPTVSLTYSGLKKRLAAPHCSKGSTRATRFGLRLHLYLVEFHIRGIVAFG